MIIALDGPSGTGKSTTAKAVASNLNIAYLDTGAMYRALTFNALEQKISHDNEAALAELALNLDFEFKQDGSILVNSKVLGDEIRTPEVSSHVSKYCQLPAVRSALTEAQRKVGQNQSCILDGRDIGTVVFPNADYKFFMLADYKVRAQRRLAELKLKNIKATLEEVEANLRERDELDSNRKEAPLRQAEDASQVDTTYLSIHEQVERICSIVRVGHTTKRNQPQPKGHIMSKLIYGTEEDLLEMLQTEREFGEVAFDSDDEALAPYFESLSGLEVGKVVSGTVHQITDNEVVIDVAFKSEGVVDLSEFRDVPDLKEGDQVDVYIEALENREGRLVLSKQRADFIRVWEKIREAFENNEVVPGTLTRRIKGGVVVDLFGIEAFLPGSQIDLRSIPDINALIGKAMDVKVIKVNKARRNIVVSRRVVLEEERARLRGDVLSNLEKHQVRTGVVKNITDFGAFIDLGGVDGLLHITDMSYRRINHPSEMVTLGQEVTVKVLDFNDEKERISLGMKQMQEHPWKDAMSKFPEGSVIDGKVVSITDYGAFVELQDGVEGLIHVSEMSWTHHVKHPTKILTVGETISCQVLKVDVDSEKISLGLKQLEIDPWEDIENQLPPGAKVTGEIRNLASFGAFVEIKEGVDGLIHVSDMSWTKKIAHPSEFLKKGENVECIVLAVDRDKRRISLSMKHLAEDPWDTVQADFPLKSEVKGKILRLLDRGVVLELENGMEGFVPLRNLSSEDIKVPSESFKVGDEVPTIVSEIDFNNRKLFLSAVDYFKTKEAAEYQEWIADHQPSTNTLAEAAETED